MDADIRMEILINILNLWTISSLKNGLIIDAVSEHFKVVEWRQDIYGSFKIVNKHWFREEI